MIEIIGSQDCPEYEAALNIKKALEKLWPGIGTSPISDDHVKIASSVKLSGYKVSDIDIVVAANFRKKRYIVPKTVFIDKNGKRVTGAKILVRSFIGAVELKDHDANRVRIEAGNVSVKYRERWKSATDQNDAQRYALLNYLKDKGIDNPWVFRCLYMRGLQELAIVRGRKVPESGVVAADIDATKLIMAMANVNGISKSSRDYIIGSGTSDSLDDVLSTSIFQSIRPSRLDRLRMDRIAARPGLARELAEGLGDGFLHLRGQGGTGKTVLLLQTAFEAFQSRGVRSLILTYNHALAADIQRLLALMKMPSSDEAGGIDVRTVMSFTSAWLDKLGVTDETKDFYLDYEKNCVLALRYMREGLVTPDELSSFKEQNADQFDYDAILIDEAQDLPQAEKNLLTEIYGQYSFAIADGMSQLVRGRPTNWKAVDESKNTKPLHFQECLRMKSNLGTFVNAVAKAASLNWRITPNQEAAGGRIILLKRPYAAYPNLRRDLSSRAKDEGNSPVDFLHCVSPDNVKAAGNKQISDLGALFETEGLEVWDGVDEMTRQDYPRSVDSYRIVQHQSCRGLEGWLVVLDGLDRFWSLKAAEAAEDYNADNASARMMSRHDYVQSRAWDWVMIALTRPIDTLVISLHDTQSPAAQLLLTLANGHPDLIEVVN
ncbi:MAG: DNA/RNA helicase domain-containing protein [Hyphomonadaceae bacterium]